MKRLTSILLIGWLFAIGHTVMPSLVFADVTGHTVMHDPTLYPHVSSGNWDESGTACAGTAVSMSSYMIVDADVPSEVASYGIAAGTYDYDSPQIRTFSSLEYRVYYFDAGGTHTDYTTACDNQTVVSFTADTSAFSITPAGQPADPSLVTDPYDITFTPSDPTLLQQDLYYQAHVGPDSVCSTPVLGSALTAVYEVSDTNFYAALDGSTLPVTLAGVLVFSPDNAVGLDGCFVGYGSIISAVSNWIVNDVPVAQESATSSPDQVQLNLWLAYFAFFFSMVFTVWMLRPKH